LLQQNNCFVHGFRDMSNEVHHRQVMPSGKFLLKEFSPSEVFFELTDFIIFKRVCRFKSKLFLLRFYHLKGYLP